MGAIADAIANYAQPLLDVTDGSADQLNRALSLSQFCWNLALLPEDARDEALAKMQPTLKMDDNEFDAFRRSVVIPMMRRHEEMFPHMHRLESRKLSSGAPAQQHRPMVPMRVKKYPGTGRNARCPCNSGRKYKLCCGR